MTFTNHQQSGRMRAIMVPGRRHVQNSYFPLLLNALEDAGADMLNLRSSAAVTFRFDILLVHFPEHVITEPPLYSALILGPMFLAYIAAARALGKKFVWAVHEIYPKRRQWLARPYLWCARAFASAYVFMSRNSEEEFFKQYPGERRKIIRRIPLSSYPAKEIPADRRSEVRASLARGAECLLVGFLGEIKPYKNPAALQSLPMRGPEGKPLRLVVAGEFHRSCDLNDIGSTLRAIGPNRLVRITERLSDERLSELIQSIDLIFMPYLQGWNSGFAMYALGCGAQLLCSALPMFHEIEQSLGAPWIYLFDAKAADLSQELNLVLAQVTRRKPDAADRARLKQFLAERSLEHAASEYVELFQNI